MRCTSLRGQEGFIATTISGIIRVNNNSIVIDSDLPRLVTTFISEDKIRDVINEQLDRLFSA